MQTSKRKTLLEYAGVLDTLEESMFKPEVRHTMNYIYAVREAIETIREIYRFRDSMRELKEDGIKTLEIDTLLNEIENLGFLERNKKLSQYQREQEEIYLGDVKTFMEVGSPREIQYEKFKRNTPIGTEINVSDLEELEVVKCRLCRNGIITKAKDDKTLVIKEYV